MFFSLAYTLFSSFSCRTNINLCDFIFAVDGPLLNLPVLLLGAHPPLYVHPWDDPRDSLLRVAHVGVFQKSNSTAFLYLVENVMITYYPTEATALFTLSDVLRFLILISFAMQFILFFQYIALVPANVLILHPFLVAFRHRYYCS